MYKNNVVVKLIMRDDGNKCGDKLVNMAIDIEQEFVKIKDVPWVLRNLVEQDAN